MRWLKIFLVCSGLVCGAAGYYCWSMMPSRAVPRALAEQMRRGPGTEIDFRQVAPFAWDRVFIFGPYTPKSRINDCLGFSWNGARLSDIDSWEGSNLVVFVRNQAVVCWFDFSRGEGELEGLMDSKGYTREEAKFRVIQEPGQRLCAFEMNGDPLWSR